MTAREFEKRLAHLEGGTGSSRDMIYVGWCLLNGEEVSSDVERGKEWLIRAAQLGNGEACLRLADMYTAGDVVPRDCAQAALWYDRAERGDGFHGIYGVAVAVYFGNECLGVDRDRALLLFQKAAARGHIPSKAQWARMCRSGEYGLWRRVLGNLLVPLIAIQAIFESVRGDPDERLFDAGRWLPNSEAFARLRAGTRYE